MARGSSSRVYRGHQGRIHYCSAVPRASHHPCGVEDLREELGGLSMRKLGDWLDSFIEYGHSGEAPDNTLFWSGASAIAGALQRKVWIDQVNFKWVPNMSVVIVAPPGVVSKPSTAEMGNKLLKKVEGVCIGPNVTTWQALVSAFEPAQRLVEYAPGDVQETYSLTIC